MKDDDAHTEMDLVAYVGRMSRGRFTRPTYPTRDISWLGNNARPTGREGEAIKAAVLIAQEEHVEPEEPSDSPLE